MPAGGASKTWPKQRWRVRARARSSTSGPSELRPTTTRKTINELATHPSGPDIYHAYDQAAIGLCYFDTNLRYLHINNWLADLNGIPVEKHLGRMIHVVIPDVAAGVEAQLRRVIETNTPIIEGTVEAETPAQPSVRRTFIHDYLPVTAEDGTVVGVSCLVQDITDRRKAEVELKERAVELDTANRALREALENVSTLRGMVPICSLCKNVRNDRGFWEGIEDYVSRYSLAEFSHGICDSCLERRYPDKVDDPKQGT